MCMSSFTDPSFIKGQTKGPITYLSCSSVNSMSSTSSTTKSYEKTQSFSISEYINKIQNILKEYSDMLDHFIQIAKNSKTLSSANDIFEALNYEFQIRINEIQLFFTKLATRESELQCFTLLKNRISLIESHSNKPQECPSDSSIRQLDTRKQDKVSRQVSINHRPGTRYPRELSKTRILDNQKTPQAKTPVAKIELVEQQTTMQRASDRYEPLVDIISTSKYMIYIELPGLSIEEIELQRSNVVTIVRGQKEKIEASKDNYQRQERKFGEFEVRFKIPNEYERKWNSFSMINGVLIIEYLRDEDETLV